MGVALTKLWERVFSKGNFKMIIIGLVFPPSPAQHDACDAT